MAREVDGTNNAPDDVGKANDPYIRITPDSDVANATGGPNSGMALPVTPTTTSFPGFTDDGGFFQNVVFPLEQLGGPLTGPMPQARTISDAVMAAGTANIPSSAGVNEWFDFFGQVLTHDLAEAETAATADLPLLIDGLPFPFARTPFVDDSNGVRQQLNEETSFLDLSMVYGNNQASHDLARADLPGHTGQSAKLLLGPDGLLPTIKAVGIDAGLTSLQVLAVMRPDGFGGLPDPATNPPDARRQPR